MNDRALVQLAIQRLNAFQNGTLQLNALVGGLEEIAGSLGEARSTWKQGFYEYWTALETVNALRLDGDNGNRDEQDDFLKNTVAKLTEHFKYYNTSGSS